MPFPSRSPHCSNGPSPIHSTSIRCYSSPRSSPHLTVPRSLKTKWDLWQFEGDWKLMPARAILTCFSSGFEDPDGDDLRVDFGSDAVFLPDAELPNSLFMSQSNLKSLLHFVHEADSALAVESRRLWTESGENFAERLQATLEQT